MASNLHTQVVAILNERMSEVGMTQVEMCRRIGWTPKHLCHILSGKAEPSMASLDFMCFVLDLTLAVHVEPYCAICDEPHRPCDDPLRAAVRAEGET